MKISWIFIYNSLQTITKNKIYSQFENIVWLTNNHDDHFWGKCFKYKHYALVEKGFFQNKFGLISSMQHLQLKSF